MKIRSIAIVATLAAIAALPGFVLVKAAAQNRETVTPAFQEAISNIPGKSLTGLVVSYPPGGKAPGAYPRPFRLHPRLRALRLDPKPGEWRKMEVLHAGELGLSRLARITRSVRTPGG